MKINFKLQLATLSLIIGCLGFGSQAFSTDLSEKDVEKMTQAAILNHKLDREQNLTNPPQVFATQPKKAPKRVIPGNTQYSTQSYLNLPDVSNQPK